ncbi:cyclin-dependent kinase inhibitor 1 isoform X1 [Zonotrichia albicollis]|uniref:cyclin-dependent kinase inhibitor 1 isoform X1 n=2 Tax=Zonotrichia TaxID=44387 RepID=UPI003D80CC4C
MGGGCTRRARSLRGGAAREGNPGRRRARLIPALAALLKGGGGAQLGQTRGAGAATMPLSQSRAGQSPCSSKACRNLFGPVDHEQLQQAFEDQMKQQLEEAQQRWNFNFETETPLEGPFKWERMLVAEQAPKEVHSLVRAVISSDSRSSLAHRVPPKERGVGRVCPEEAQQSSKVCRAGSLQGLKRGQTTIKDFYSAKRRIVPARPQP